MTGKTRNRALNLQVKLAQNRALLGQIAAKKKNKRTAAEVTKLGKALRTIGMAGGGVVGGYLGNPAFGANAGKGIGALVSKWLGQGDYTVVENSIVKATSRGSDSVPMMHRTNQSITIRHKEFVSQLTGSTGFSVRRVLPINPGLNQSFPWLASLAAKFEQYRIKGLVYHYVPTSGLAVSSTNPAIGSVMMQTSYRSARDPTTIQPTSKVEMLNEYWACEAAPNEAFCHPIECSPSENPFAIHYVRTSEVPSDDSVLMYDLGATFIATSGMPADGNVVGDLWATYEIEFLKPLVSNPVVDLHLDGYAQTSTTGSTSSSFFGSTPINSTGSLKFTLSGKTITFAVGTLGSFQLVFALHGAPTGSGFMVNGVSYSGCSSIKLIDQPSTGWESVYAAIDRDQFLAQARILITDPNVPASITLSSSAQWTDCHYVVTVTSI
jgi:hypothetical protein